ncbi:helix-turn-helix domain-containing protein [Enterococcus sp. DIV0240a]|uniref:helix-turn-helix domain-containing protein n=1 Tax=unclassified Enterococcus TaxID=2608891 RepID=UPI003D2A28F8
MTTFDRIKELSKKRGKTPKQVATELGLGENLFYKWKNSSPTADKLQLVADYFHVSTDYLLGRTDDPNAGVSPEKRKMTVEEALATVMSSDGKPLTDNDREILSAMIEAYLEKKDN